MWCFKPPILVTTNSVILEAYMTGLATISDLTLLKVEVVIYLKIVMEGRLDKFLYITRKLGGWYSSVM